MWCFAWRPLPGKRTTRISHSSGRYQRGPAALGPKKKKGPRNRGFLHDVPKKAQAWPHVVLEVGLTDRRRRCVLLELSAGFGPSLISKCAVVLAVCGRGHAVRGSSRPLTLGPSGYSGCVATFFKRLDRSEKAGKPKGMASYRHHHRSAGPATVPGSHGFGGDSQR